MSMAIENIKALCFDFGNTLVEFGPKQVIYQYAALERVLTEMFGFCCPDFCLRNRSLHVIPAFRL